MLSLKYSIVLKKYIKISSTIYLSALSKSKNILTK